MNAIQPNLAPNPSGPNKAKGKVPMVIVLIPSPIPYSTAKTIKPAKVAPKPNKIENPSVIKPKEIKLVIKGCSARPKINSKNRPAVLAGPINAPALTATAALCPNASTLLTQSDIKAPIIYPEKVKDSTIQIMAWRRAGPCNGGQVADSLLPISRGAEIPFSALRLNQCAGTQISNTLAAWICHVTCHP